MAMAQFDEYVTLMGMYIDSAKTYLQLSTFALGFSLAFLEKLRVKKRAVGRDSLLILSWLGFILAVGFSSFYQYLAVKFLDQRSSNPGSLGLIPVEWARAPGYFYGAMLVSFYLGVLALSLLMFRRSGSIQGTEGGE
jgi:hypothetical protein